MTNGFLTSIYSQPHQLLEALLKKTSLKDLSPEEAERLNVIEMKKDCAKLLEKMLGLGFKKGDLRLRLLRKPDGSYHVMLKERFFNLLSEIMDEGPMSFKNRHHEVSRLINDKSYSITSTTFSGLTIVSCLIAIAVDRVVSKNKLEKETRDKKAALQKKRAIVETKRRVSELTDAAIVFHKIDPAKISHRVYYKEGQYKLKGVYTKTRNDTFSFSVKCARAKGDASCIKTLTTGLNDFLRVIIETKGA